MTHEVVMPQLGLTMTEGAISAWLKGPGERVEKGEVLFTVETDKVEMEVESTVSGYVAALVTEPKELVGVGTTIALIVDSEEEIESARVLEKTGANGASSPTGPEPAVTPVAVLSTAQPPPAGQYAASPLAKRLAKELGVSLRGIIPAKGSRITAEDVQRVHAAAPAPAPVLPRAPLANRVTASFRDAPHFYLGLEVDASRLVELRRRLLASAESAAVRISYTDFFLKGMAQALREQPLVNVSWQDGNVRPNTSIDIGFAAQTDDRLLVPVIRNIDGMPLAAISRERARLSESTRSGKLTLAQMEGGSATLSNLGAYGIDWFEAILNPPQSVIIATGRIASRAVVVDGTVQARDTVWITASVDHRVLDGVAGARYLSRIRELLEDPELLLAL